MKLSSKNWVDSLSIFHPASIISIDNRREARNSMLRASKTKKKLRSTNVYKKKRLNLGDGSRMLRFIDLFLFSERKEKRRKLICSRDQPGREEERKENWKASTGWLKCTFGGMQKSFHRATKSSENLQPSPIKFSCEGTEKWEPCTCILRMNYELMWVRSERNLTVQLWNVTSSARNLRFLWISDFALHNVELFRINKKLHHHRKRTAKFSSSLAQKQACKPVRTSNWF